MTAHRKGPVDAEIEQGEVAFALFKLEPDPDRPHVLRLERAFLADQTAFVPWGTRQTESRLVAPEHDRLLRGQPRRVLTQPRS